ncbi:MAG: SpoIID/LytB domain-containing protein [Acidimicrobiales bacterium]
MIKRLSPPAAILLAAVLLASALAAVVTVTTVAVDPAGATSPAAPTNAGVPIGPPPTNTASQHRPSGSIKLPPPRRARTAYPYPDVNFVGHGWGPGVGMGQWGAFGYAIGADAGAGPQTYQWIVDHFYAPASLRQAPSPDSSDTEPVSVAMTQNNQNFLIATAPGGVTLPGGGSAPAVMFSPGATSSSWNYQSGSGCAGPWSAPTATSTNSTSSAGGGPITLCIGAGGDITMNGSLKIVYNASLSLRTVNVLPMNEYLDAVVPSESPAGWGTFGGSGPQGHAWGFQELEAQAVAARSYALANPNGYGGYADTCDQYCQSYPGTLNVNALSNSAVSDTSGQVMEFASQAIATTEYSASTGGYTSGGPFNAVVDAGDSVCVPNACNPNHTWSASVPVSEVDATWPQIGTLDSLNVTSRNGLGDLGGRVNSIVVTGSSGSVTLTGGQFAADLGLNSDWFAITSQPIGGVGGYWLAGQHGGVFAFGNAQFYGSMGGRPLNKPIVGIAATPNGGGYFEVASDGGVFAFGNAQFYGSMGGRPLNKPIVGIAATPNGGGYWEVASDGGVFSFGNAQFYGSMGGRPLNKPIVGIAATPNGGGYFEVASDGGVFAFGNAQFYGSMGGVALLRPVVGIAPTPNGGGYFEVASDGGVFTFGNAVFNGSASGTATGAGTVAILPTHTGQGYLLVDGAGQVTNVGDSPQFGDLTTVLSSYQGHIVGAATSPG